MFTALIRWIQRGKTILDREKELYLLPSQYLTAFFPYTNPISRTPKFFHTNQIFPTPKSHFPSAPSILYINTQIFVILSCLYIYLLVLNFLLERVCQLSSGKTALTTLRGEGRKGLRGRWSLVWYSRENAIVDEEVKRWLGFEESVKQIGFFNARSRCLGKRRTLLIGTKRWENN